MDNYAMYKVIEKRIMYLTKAVIKKNKNMKYEYIPGTRDYNNALSDCIDVARRELLDMANEVEEHGRDV